MRSLKTNIYKIISGLGFYICIVFTVILCFSANIYTDIIKNDHYSVFSAVRTFDREFMLTDTSFCSFNVICNAASGWLTMFIPIVSAFAYIPLVCDEYESKSVRFEIFRTGKKSYHLSRFVTACFCGGLAVTIGYAVFSVLAFILFPSLSDYNIYLKDSYLEMTSYSFPEIQSGLALPIFKTLGSVFLYGAVSAVPAIMLTAVIRNKYLVMCIPFFLKYAIGQTCLKLQSRAVADYEHIDAQLLRLSGIIDPDSLIYLPKMGSNKKAVLIYNGVIVIIALAIYLIIQSGRTDSGE